MNLSFLPFLTAVILFLISSKKFQAKGTKVIASSSGIVFNASIDFIGICCPGVNLFCFNLLSSIIKFKGLLTKFRKVLPFAAAPYPTSWVSFLCSNTFGTIKVYVFMINCIKLVIFYHVCLASLNKNMAIFL